MQEDSGSRMIDSAGLALSALTDPCPLHCPSSNCSSASYRGRVAGEVTRAARRESVGPVWWGASLVGGWVPRAA